MIADPTVRAALIAAIPLLLLFAAWTVREQFIDAGGLERFIAKLRNRGGY